MSKYIIRTNVGYGDEYEEIEVDNLEEAEQASFEIWREASEQYADYEVIEWTEENAEDYL